MRLSAPTNVVFIISAILALLAILATFAGVAVPFISDNGFLTMTVAWALLTVGALFKGL